MERTCFVGGLAVGQESPLSLKSTVILITKVLDIDYLLGIWN